MEVENWKAVVGYEGLYEVSDLGRVRSLDREVTFVWGASNSSRSVTHKRRGLLLSLTPNPVNGYVYVGLHVGGRVKLVRVHRVVLLAFAGTPPTGSDWVNHKDLDRTNNNLSNLEYCSPSENSAHARDNGRLHKWSRGHSTGAYSKELVDEAFSLIAAGELNGKQIGEKLGLPCWFAAALRRGGTWLSSPGDTTRPSPIASASAATTPGRRRVLTLQDAREIYALAKAGGESQSSIAKRFGVHQAMVSNILTGKSWAGIT